MLHTAHMKGSELHTTTDPQHTASFPVFTSTMFSGRGISNNALIIKEHILDASTQHNTAWWSFFHVHCQNRTLCLTCVKLTA